MVTGIRHEIHVTASYGFRGCRRSLSGSLGLRRGIITQTLAGKHKTDYGSKGQRVHVITIYLLKYL
jgi:hypothetical protein